MKQKLSPFINNDLEEDVKMALIGIDFGTTNSAMDESIDHFSEWV
ncbi:hypothetical protein [Neobacillus soli]|nr:hypothetical protein [Neobacillus soli]